MTPSHAQHQVTPWLADRAAQGGLLMRLGFYWGIMLGYFSATMLISTWVDAPAGTPLFEILLAWASEIALWLPASLVILPLVAHDFIRFSQRILVPIKELESQLGKLAAKEESFPIANHDDDFWHKTLKDYNEVRDELNHLRALNQRNQVEQVSNLS